MVQDHDMDMSCATSQMVQASTLLANAMSSITPKWNKSLNSNLDELSEFQKSHKLLSIVVDIM